MQYTLPFHVAVGPKVHSLSSEEWTFGPTATRDAFQFPASLRPSVPRSLRPSVPIQWTASLPSDMFHQPDSPSFQEKPMPPVTVRTSCSGSLTSWLVAALLLISNFAMQPALADPAPPPAASELHREGPGS